MAGFFTQTLTQAQTTLAPSSPVQDIHYWIARTQRNPNDAMAWFNLSVLRQRDKKYDEAHTGYEKVVQLNSPLSPVALYYNSLVYVAQNNPAAAKALLVKINIEKVPIHLKTKVLGLKNKLFLADFAEQKDLTDVLSDQSKTAEKESAVKKEKSFSGYAEINYGSNSNPQTEADLTSNQISSDNQTQGRLNLGYQFYANSDFEVRADYAFSATSFQKNTGSNFNYHDLVIPLSYYFDAYRFRLSPEYYQDTYGGPAFSNSLGGTLELTLRDGNSFYGLSGSSQNIKNVTTTYSYLTGSQSKVALSASSEWSANSFSFAPYFTKLQYQDTSTLGSSYQAFGANANYTRLELPWIFALSLGYEQRNYVKATADTFARTDKRTFAELRIGYLLNANWKLNLDASTTDNSSNFNTTTNNRSYKQTILVGGISVGF
ncbi:MAG: hypothetical protein H7256_14745 [Bdellovibrio sp.]|nr:hypothetical protein [Bdellovibrio sp.]